MYICEECGRKFTTEEALSKHYLSCWKEHHTGSKSKDAPRSEDVTIREVSQDILDFFNSFE